MSIFIHWNYTDNISNAIFNKINLVSLVLSFFLINISCKPESETAIPSNDFYESYLKDYSPPRQKWGYVDRNGREVITAIYDDARDFSEGFAAVNSQGLWGYINPNGEWHIKPTFREAYDYSEGFGLVLDFQRRYWLFDRHGQGIQELPYAQVFPVKEKFIRIFDGYYYGFINIEGQKITEARFDFASDFSNGLAIVSEAERYGLIDTSGTIILDIDYEEVKQLKNNLYQVLDKSSWRIWNKDGFITTPQSFKNAVGNSGDFIGLQSLDNSWNLWNPLTDEFKTTPYHRILPGGEKMWMVSRDGKYGIISNDGSPITPEQYDILYRYSEGRAGFQRGEFWGYLDEEGNEVLPPLFPLIWDYKNHAARVIYQGGIQFIDKDGKLLFDRAFVEVRDFHEGKARFQKYR